MSTATLYILEYTGPRPDGSKRALEAARKQHEALVAKNVASASVRLTEELRMTHRKLVIVVGSASGGKAMARMRALGVLLAGLAFLTLIPAVASAQNSGVAGLVRDTTGGVLPGVTVEAASPALIEKVRTVVTDAQGRYNIVNLRPGPYSVTFTLPGFTTFRREGIELTTNFTANVNADLSVGAVEETVSVSAAVPTVDVQNVIQHRLLTAEIVDAIPSGRTYRAGYSALCQGAGLSGPENGRSVNRRHALMSMPFEYSVIIGG